jgi:hypothetical protein
MRHAIMNRAILVVTALALGLIFGPRPASAATIVIVNNDGPGEGFNDPTPVAPVGGNPGTTLGQQRLNAFQYAADIWGQDLFSSITIEVEAQMDPLFCDATSAVLGSAGATFIHRDWTSGTPPPRAATWYTQAEANAISGVDQNPGTSEISATFNSSLNGDPGCLGGIGWYYGYDQSPGGDIDFVTVVFHEIAHGLGFLTFVDLSTGAKLLGFDDTYEWNMERHFAVPADYPSMTDAQRASANTSDPNLHWIGSAVNAIAPGILTAGISNGHVRLHGPNPVQPGSSLSHWSTALSPNQVMEPAYTGPDHDGTLELALFEDIGWPLISDDEPAVPSASPWGLAILAAVVASVGVFVQRRRARASTRA